MRKYYTRPCNFYYGNYAKSLVKIKKALPLAGNSNISFDQLEIFQRKIGGGIKSLEDMREVLLAGAEKVSINTAAVLNPKLFMKEPRLLVLSVLCWGWM